LGNSDPEDRFYFDGATTAAFEIRASEFGSKLPFVEPLASKYEPKVSLLPQFAIVRSFVPMPFRRSCKVTSSEQLIGNAGGGPVGSWNGPGGWGHIMYHAYPTADGITTFTGREDYSKLISIWQNTGKDPKDTTGNIVDAGTVSIKAGQTVPIFDKTGAGSISSIRLNIPLAPMTWLNNLWIRIQWENESTPAVLCPIGAFFGNELGLNRNSYLMHGMTADGSFYSYWPMPFWEAAKISLVNKAGIAVDLTFNIRQKPSTVLAYPRDETAHFRASAYQPPLAKLPLWDSPIGSLEGSGHFVSGIITGWSNTLCEGDVRVMIDNAGTPRVESDGSESWACYGWGFENGPQTNPMSGFDGPKSSGYNIPWSMNRSCTGDWYPFRTKLRLSLEGSWGKRMTDVRGGVLLYYGESKPAMVQSDFVDIGNSQSETTHHYADSGAVPVSLNSSYEGEMDDVLISDNGRKFSQWSTFTVKIDTGNQGVMLRRRSDQNTGRQRARVYVDGVPVTERSWYFADRNTIKRWLDDEFVIPASYTHGKNSITIRIEPQESGGIKTWNQYYFWVFSLLGQGSEVIPSGLYFSIEAESGTLVSPMQKGSNSAASGGQYITTPAGTGNTIFPKAEATFPYNAVKADTYYVWLRVLAPSVNPTANYGTFVGFNTFSSGKSPILNWTANEYTWIRSTSFGLNAGLNQLILGHGNEQIQIDKIIITNNPETVLPSVIPPNTKISGFGAPQKANQSVLSMATSNKAIIFQVYLQQGGSFTLRTYNISGRKIWEYRQESCFAGIKRIPVDKNLLKNGIYMTTLTDNNAFYPVIRYAVVD
jgi:hypothetical protein